MTKAIEAGIRSGILVRAGPSFKEQDLVWGLVARGVPVLRRRLPPLLRPLGLDVRVAGVYCHGTPQVEWSDEPVGQPPQRHSCEIGDLLVATRYASAPGRVYRRALLLQFKLAGGDQVHGDQRELLPSMAALQLLRAAGLTGASRRVTPRSHAGAQFALIGPPHGTTRWRVRSGWVSTVEWNSRQPHPLAAELTDLVLGSGGERVSTA